MYPSGKCTSGGARQDSATHSNALRLSAIGAHQKSGSTCQSVGGHSPAQEIARFALSSYTSAIHILLHLVLYAHAYTSKLMRVHVYTHSCAHTMPHARHAEAGTFSPGRR